MLYFCFSKLGPSATVWHECLRRRQLQDWWRRASWNSDRKLQTFRVSMWRAAQGFRESPSLISHPSGVRTHPTSLSVLFRSDRGRAYYFQWTIHIMNQISIEYSNARAKDRHLKQTIIKWVTSKPYLITNRKPTRFSMQRCPLEDVVGLRHTSLFICLRLMRS